MHDPGLRGADRVRAVGCGGSAWGRTGPDEAMRPKLGDWIAFQLTA